jgi:hypothetical protein
VEEQASGAQAVVQAMERMRELVQASTAGSTELAASSDQMSKMSRGLLDSMDRFSLRSNDRNNDDRNNDRNNDRSSDRTGGSGADYNKGLRGAAAGSH